MTLVIDGQVGRRNAARLGVQLVRTFGRRATRTFHVLVNLVSFRRRVQRVRDTCKTLRRCVDETQARAEL